MRTNGSYDAQTTTKSTPANVVPTSSNIITSRRLFEEMTIVSGKELMPTLFTDFLTLDMVIRFTERNCSVDINANSGDEPFNDFTNTI